MAPSDDGDDDWLDELPDHSEPTPAAPAATPGLKRRGLLSRRSNSVPTSELGAAHARTSTAAAAAAAAASTAAAPPASCTHDFGFFGGMCVACGTKKEDIDGFQHADLNTENGGVTLAAFGVRRQTHVPPSAGAKLELTRRAASEALNAEEVRLRRERKLSLILDLDHTLLNSARGEDVVNEEQKLAATLAAQQAQRVVAEQLQQQSADQPMAEVEPKTPVQTNGVSQAPALTLIDRLNAWAGAERAPDARCAEPSLFHMPHLGGMWTKLRPGARELLATVAERFDISVSTLGDRQYAEAMLDLLDPTQTHVRRSVSSTNLCARGEHATGDGMSKAIGAHLACEALTAVVDDTEHVWPASMQNGTSTAALIGIGRYHFFPSSARGFGLDPWRACILGRGYPQDEGVPRPEIPRGGETGGGDAASPAPTGEDKFVADYSAQRHAIAERRPADSNIAAEEDEGEPLRALTRALLTAHALVYPSPEDEARGIQVAANSRDAIRRVRRQALRGCVLLFSRVVPTAAKQAAPADGTPAQRPNSRSADRHPIERMAETLGARIATDSGPDVTHVVTRHGSLGTSKVRWALGENKLRLSTEKTAVAGKRSRADMEESDANPADGSEPASLVHIVHVSWLLASRDLWRRADELEHVVRRAEDPAEEREWNRVARSSRGDAAARERQRARASAGVTPNVKR
ncbi:RNA polymerase II C-terminal domain phosphatase [Pycnococcus provasolii]